MVIQSLLLEIYVVASDGSTTMVSDMYIKYYQMVVRSLSSKGYIEVTDSGIASLSVL